MRLSLFQVDAFTSRVSEAEVRPLRLWQGRGYAVAGSARQRAHGRENTVMRLRKALC